MRRTIYPAVCALALILGGCYGDKGNYDYSEINEMSVTFTPEAAQYDAEHYAYTYTYRQPATEPLSVTYTPQVAQSQVEGDANLEYEWIVTKNSKTAERDTVRTRELTLEFAPKVKTTYDVRFRLTDSRTGIDLYRSFRMMTEVPFIHSWFVLHGAEGERRLGVVEYPDNSERTEAVADAYEAMHEQDNPFGNVTGMFYMAYDGSDNNAPEHLTMLEPSEAYYMHAFDLVVSSRGYKLMVPEPEAKLRLSYGVTNNAVGRQAIIVTEDGKFIHGGPNGFYHNPLTQPDAENYRVDAAFISPEGYLTIWDGAMKRFMYYYFQGNWYTWYNGEGRPDGVANNALLTPFPAELFAEGEMDGRRAVWIGQALTPATETGGTAIVCDGDGAYHAYMFGFGDGKDDKDGGGDEGAVKLSRRVLTGFAANDGSSFATSTAFAEQIFYSAGNAVYHYNLVTGENTEIYTVAEGATITGLQFRASYPHYAVETENQKLAVVVLAAGGQKGELHELTFSQSADVTGKVVFDGGFGPIKQIDYSFLHRVIR